jgi:multisubunit Na+/H+ antiporter MnhG subunit
MPAVAWVTVIIAALIIAVAAVGLLRVVMHLMAVRQTLGTVIVGTWVIAHQTSTVPERLTSVNANLKPVADFCETV